MRIGIGDGATRREGRRRDCEQPLENTHRRMLNLVQSGMATLRASSVEIPIAAFVRPWSSRVIKRAVDVVGAVLAVLLFAPIMLIVAIAIRLTSRGPIIFAQERCGLGGRRFRFYKFRTMVDGAEDRRADLDHLNEMRGPVFKISRDPRITRVGALLRKTSLDELPQLWNVLRGEMSLVGPRPPLPEEVARYDARQFQRLGVVPGITGLWQVSGRSCINDFETWLELDLAYVRRWSLWLDFRILAKTIVVVISARGAQ
jgi:exopolysaccharide biosynthesis polyprenyl glycosylphosphotransferase